MLKYFSKFFPLLLVASLLGSANLLLATSLWKKASGNTRSLYADKVARTRGDILTIVVNESNTMVNKLRMKTDKNATIDNNVTNFLWAAASSNLGTHNGSLPQLNTEGDNEYDAGGEISNSQSVSATVSVMVIDTLPNGNLVIEGARLVTFTGERQYAVLRGIVRPYDVRTDNSILSTHIADARVEFISEGNISEAQKKGWFTKVNDLLNPF